MKIRFVRGTAWESTAIAAQEKTAMPFTPSHVEALSPSGAYYLGAHMDGGFMRRTVGYDLGKVALAPAGYDPAVFPGGLCDLILTLPASPKQDADFYSYLESSVGEPYDWSSIVGFVIPAHLHLANHAICSAKITLALRYCSWFRWRLAAPAHLVDPRDLLLMLSAQMQIPGV